MPGYGRAGKWIIEDFDVYREQAGIIVVVSFESGNDVPGEFCMVLTEEGAKALRNKLTQEEKEG